MRCDLHCPAEDGGVFAAVAAGAGLLLAYLAAEVVESMLLAMFITAATVLAAAAYVTARVLHSHRGTSYAMYEPLTEPAPLRVVSVQARPQALAAPRRAIPAGQPHAITDLPVAQQGARVSKRS